MISTAWTPPSPYPLSLSTEDQMAKLAIVNPRKFMAKNLNVPWEACIVWNRTHQDIQEEYITLSQDSPGAKSKPKVLARAIRLLWEDEESPELVARLRSHPDYIPPTTVDN